MANLSILLIPGAFGQPVFYASILNAVTAKGYEIKGIPLTTVNLYSGDPGPGVPGTVYTDAALIASEAEKLADEGKDVIIITHSYGGVPGTESVKGLAKEDRKKQGKKGGVVRLAYVTSIVVPVGVSTFGLLSVVPDSAPTSVDANGWAHTANITRSAELTFSDIPLAEGEAWVRKMTSHSAASFVNELTYAGYKDVPTSFLFCEDDKVILPSLQQDGIDTVERESGRKADVTRIKADHCPMASQEQLTIDWVFDVIEKVEKCA